MYFSKVFYSLYNTNFSSIYFLLINIIITYYPYFQIITSYIKNLKCRIKGIQQFINENQIAPTK